MMLDESQEEKLFTLDEAQRLIPRLRKLLARMIGERERLLEMRSEIDAARENAAFNGGSVVGPRYLQHMIRFSEAIQEIEILGVHVKDLSTGLVDFPYQLDGRVVYLCWKPDEDEIGWWHETDSGFAGRQPLSDDFV
jgi:hypothetical protein